MKIDYVCKRLNHNLQEKILKIEFSIIFYNFIKMEVRTPDSFVTERLIDNNENEIMDNDLEMAIKESLKIFEIRQERESSCTRLLNTLKRVIPYDDGVKKAYEYLLESLETYYEGRDVKKEKSDFILGQLAKVRLHQEDVMLLSNIL